MMALEIEQRDVVSVVQEIGQQAKAAASEIAWLPDSQKNKVLLKAAELLREQMQNILEANAKDIAAAKAKNLDEAMLDRLVLTEKRVEGMASGMEKVAQLPEPLGKALAEWSCPNGLHIKRVSVPLGVIGVIYESRPNVTADAAALCFKSGNASILRGGSESYHSSTAIISVLHDALEAVGVTRDAIQSIPTTDREAVGAMLQSSDYIDVIVPRGGKGLCERVMNESRIPTLQHLDGNCHIYVHKDADLELALKIIENAKMRRTGICGAVESLVIDDSIAIKFIPALTGLLSESGCEVRGDAKAAVIDKRIVLATDEDWDTEYLAPVLSIKIVKSSDEAIDFVNQHSSHHTDAIITKDQAVADTFQRQIDSAIVMHNTSTQFADGGEFGMGAEIGIATGKLHARGPVGIEQLTTYKYVVASDGATRMQG